MSREELAALAIAVLNIQARYFQYRFSQDLIESKKLERRLRSECEEILGVQGGLFK
jgi:hypothetical protein